MNFKGKMSEGSGITLITLAVTIIILLILAGITIATITSDNGIIKNANNAKEQTEIAEEKEIVDRATIQAMGNNKRGNIIEDELQEQLDKITDSGKTEVSDNGEEFEVVFVDSNRYYTVDKDGNIVEEGKIVIDKSPGDITKDENGEDLKGDEEEPYEIWCIEDLVVLSNMSRGKGNYIENGEIVNIIVGNTFSGKNIELMRDLNFNSKLSYTDLSVSWSYDEANQTYMIDETGTQNLRELLMDKNEVGFIPIGSANYSFEGIFDGKNNEIKNLYENVEMAGLFEKINGTVKNLGLINMDITGTGHTGGIAAIYYSSKLYNIYISGIIKGENVGGILGQGYGNIEMINCCNTAEIQATQGTGGMIKYGDVNSKINIVNCYNSGKITGMGTSITYHAVSGIVGAAYSRGTRKIVNTCSLGEISKPKGSAQNFYYAWDSEPFELENCYYLNEIINEKVIVNEDSIEFLRDDETIVDKLNKYVEEHKNDYKDEGVTLYSWKLDSNGLPAFDK